MKPVGEQAKEFREAKKWNTTRMAAEVGTSRQNIESLEAAPNRKPRYIDKLAAVMGVTVDSLYGGGMTAKKQTVAPPLVQNQNTFFGAAVSISEAVQAIAAAMHGTDDISKATAKAVMNALIDDPARVAELAARLETTLRPALEPSKEKNHPPETGTQRAA